MMSEENWKCLKEEFENDENFNEEGWYTANEGYPPFDLMEWLECSTVRPSFRMMDIFSKHEYDVYPGEKDSFGWLIGIVEDRKTGRMMTFG